MHAVAFMVLCAAAASAAADSVRIAGGSLATIDRYPSMASLTNTQNFVTWAQECGGSILNNRAILTAAHCTGPFVLDRQRVRIGSSFSQSGGTVFGVSRYIRHPSYGSSLMGSDIAILHLNGFITYNANTQPGRFAGPNFNVPLGASVWAAGWGISHNGGSVSEQLRHVQLWTVSQAQCRTHFGSMITDAMICVLGREFGQGTCSCDSGGPIFHNGVIVGVISFGGQVCGSDVIPSVNMNVSRYISWIQANA
ncbi:trypsin, alkaline B-like [Anticarsia gemmatalis]|uniref:trypsin, alkaline B-like n=1 Tax=Anticarsia gemmatalis TaxID=129554 RepID=UPI003F761051